MTIPFVDLKTQYQALKKTIDERIQNVLDHGQFILGPEVGECETALARYVGCKHAITCGSGTDALVLALMAWGIGPNDEVIVPAFSFIATAEAVVLVGATPVFVDIDPITYNLEVNELEGALTSKTKAIIPVSLYGQTADMAEINAFAKAKNLVVIEDAAQSFGASYRDQKSGHLSDVACTSFFPAKPLGAYGEGGAVFTDDDEKAELVKQLRVHGQSARYHHLRVGLNARMDTLQCAILLAKLERFPWELEQRQKIADRYNEAFTHLGSQGVTLPQIKGDRTSAWAQYTLQVPHRQQFQNQLKELGIPTAVHYPTTMADQPTYRNYIKATTKLDVARAMAERVVSLPMYPDMPDDTLAGITQAVIKHAGQ